MLNVLMPLVRMTGPTTMLFPFSLNNVAVLLKTTRLLRGAVFRFQSSNVAPGKTVMVRNEDGLLEKYSFLPGGEFLQTPLSEPQDFDVAIALDTATKFETITRVFPLIWC